MIFLTNICKKISKLLCPFNDIVNAISKYLISAPLFHFQAIIHLIHSETCGIHVKILFNTDNISLKFHVIMTDKNNNDISLTNITYLCFQN